MGGAITLQSAGLAGAGTTFTGHAPFEVGGEPPAPIVPAAPAGLKGQRLLVAVPNAAQRAALLRLLAAWSITTVEAGTWEELVAASATANVSAGIVDACMLPEHAAACAIPLLVLTNLDAPSQRAPHGVHMAVLRKPIFPAALLDALSRILASAPTARPAPASTVWDAAIGVRQPLRILVAEDNPVNRKVIQAMLRRFGYTADYVANGVEAVAAVAAADYDVVLMDVQMPELDGQEATRRIRTQLPPERQPRIVAVTANAFEDQRKHYLTVGMDDYISKPIEPALLAAVLERAWQAVSERVSR
jgi:CheY-like chemotaxis protein